MQVGTGHSSPGWSPTLSGLMSVLSVPVLTMSPSGLQFLLAIATRLPFWLGPADLKRRGNIVCVGRALGIPLKFSKCILTKWRGVRTHRTHTGTRAVARPHNEGMRGPIST